MFLLCFIKIYIWLTEESIAVMICNLQNFYQIKRMPRTFPMRKRNSNSKYRKRNSQFKNWDLIPFIRYFHFLYYGNKNFYLIITFCTIIPRKPANCSFSIHIFASNFIFHFCVYVFTHNFNQKTNFLFCS